jgi:hypothetical protein
MMYVFVQSLSVNKSINLSVLLSTSYLAARAGLTLTREISDQAIYRNVTTFMLLE